jgi:hypothetical protein
VERLALAKPGRERREDVARALDALLDDQDIFMRQPLLRAAAVWGDQRTADALANRLDQKDLRDWKETLQALVDLRPDERTTVAAVRRLPEDTGHVISLLRRLGPERERALLAATKASAEARTDVSDRISIATGC